METKLKFDTLNAGLTQMELEALEDRLRCKLPPDYLTFLLDTDGGYLEVNRFEFVGLSRLQRTDLQVLYSVRCVDELSGLEAIREVLLHRIPDDALAIGTDSGGNEICLVIKGERYGQVFLWEHEYEEEFPEDPWHNMRYIAGSLKEFFNKLKFD